MVRFVLILVLILVTGGLYLNSFPGSFHYDDFPLLLENPVVTGQSFPLEVFLGLYWGRPLTLLSFHWDYQLFGENPFFFHLTNYLLHLFAVVLLYVVVKLYFGREYLAFATALIFAVHPIQSQAVNYVWSRSVLLMSVFALLCLLCGRRYPILSITLLQLAIWSRAEALLLVVPLALLVPGVRKAIYVISGVNGFILAGYMLLKPPDAVAWTHSDPVSFWLAAPLALWKYIGLMFWPEHLTIDHPLITWSIPSGLVAILALVSLLLGIFHCRKRYPWALLGVSWILLFLAPSLLIPNADLVNESRAYFAFAGFAFVFVNVIDKIGSVAPKGTTWALLLIACVLLVPLTLSRNELWQDEVSIWKEAVSYSPDGLRSRYNLGVALVRAGENNRAKAAFKEALRISPIDDMSYAALGYCAESKGAEVEALELYRTALSFNPENRYAWLRVKVIGEGSLYP